MSDAFRIARLEYTLKALIAWLGEAGALNATHVDELQEMLKSREPLYFLPVSERKVSS